MRQQVTEPKLHFLNHLLKQASKTSRMAKLKSGKMTRSPEQLWVRLFVDLGTKGKNRKLPYTMFIDTEKGVLTKQGYDAIRSAILSTGRDDNFTEGRMKDLELSFDLDKYKIYLIESEGKGPQLDLANCKLEYMESAYLFLAEAAQENDVHLIVTINDFETASSTFKTPTPDMKPTVTNNVAEGPMNFSSFTSASNTIVFKPKGYVEPDDRSPDEIDATESQFTCDDGRLFVHSKISGKDFLKSESLTLTSMDHIMWWYDVLVNHGALYGVFIPPGHSLLKNSIMGTMWTKKNAGLSKHSERPAMSALVNKLLLNEKLYSKETIHLRNIAIAAQGDGYAALHNIMRLSHPLLSETQVESRIPSQSNTMPFSMYVNNVHAYIKREAMRRRNYTKYEQLHLVLENLHGRYKSQLKQRALQEFDPTVHNKINSIPFCLEQPNLSTTLSAWAVELKLDVPKACDDVHHVAHLTDDVHAVDSQEKCEFCGDPRHAKVNCFKFINACISAQLMQREPALVKEIQRTTSRYQGGRSRPVSASKSASVVRAIESDDSALPPDPLATIRTSDEPSSPTPAELPPPSPNATNHHSVVRRIEGDFDDAESLCDDLALEPLVNFVDTHDCGHGVTCDAEMVARISDNWTEELYPTPRSLPAPSKSTEHLSTATVSSISSDAYVAPSSTPSTSGKGVPTSMDPR